MNLNQIIQGDALQVLKTIPDESVDLVVTSPPYDNIREYKGFIFDFEGIARELLRVLKQGGVIVWVVGDQTVDGSETGTSFKQALFFKEIGMKLHDTMIYDKGKVTFPDANRYHQCFEYMFIFSKGSPKTTNLLADRKNKWAKSWGKRSFRQKDGSLVQKEVINLSEMGTRYNIWRMNNGFMHTTKDTFAFEHPAMFPEELAGDHIRSWSNPGDTVLDPMNGSGTTTKMAKILGRNYLGIDISEEYCEIARKRVRQEILI